MSGAVAIVVLGGLIFGAFVYVAKFKMDNGRWPKVRNPFY